MPNFQFEKGVLMRKNRLMAGIVVIVVFIAAFTVISGFSQENIIAVQDGGFRQVMRPTVRFLHDEHNEAAGIEDCSGCHHSYDATGKKLEDESSEGTTCSECHLKDADDPVPLVMAYHGQCKGCHDDQKKGPVMCGECHVK